MHARAPDEYRDDLARMIRRLSRRIVAVIGREYHQIIRAQAREQARDPRIQLLETLMEPRHIIAVPPRLIEFDHVDEHEPRLERIERPLDEPVGVAIRRGVLAADVSPCEQ